MFADGLGKVRPYQFGAGLKPFRGLLPNHYAFQCPCPEPTGFGQDSRLQLGKGRLAPEQLRNDRQTEQGCQFIATRRTPKAHSCTIVNIEH